jgi:cytochrome P450
MDSALSNSPDSARYSPPLDVGYSPPPPEVTRLYGAEFAADPYAVYERLRRQGPLARVEIAPGVWAWLVLDYRAALDMLRDTITWTRDSRIWQQTVPADSPVMPMIGWRPNVLFSDGEEHQRYRYVITDSFDRIPPHQLRAMVVEIADSLIARFGPEGAADLMREYARMLPLMLFNKLFGLSDSYGDRLVTALAGVVEGNTAEEAAAANDAYEGIIGELIGAKKWVGGKDLTSWFMEHPVGLSDEEVVHQIAVTMGAGNEATANLIGNALARMLTEDRYYGTLSSGALTPRDAIHDVLQNEPPVANYSAYFARRDVEFHGTWVRADQLVLISYAAASTQHGRSEAGTDGGANGSGGGAHLAWSAGPHACPVQCPALIIAATAIERLTAWISDLELAVEADELVYRHGPFHRALVRLPVRFTPAPGCTGTTGTADTADAADAADTTNTTDTSDPSAPTEATEAPDTADEGRTGAADGTADAPADVG